MPEALEGLPRRMAGWAVRRSLAPNSATGISLALGLCAAAWFSAGTRPGNIRGALALVAGYLAWRAARWLAGPAVAAVSGSARAGAGTLAELGGAVSDCAVYAGLAVGGYEARWTGTWELAAAVVIAAAVRRTAVACDGHVAGVAGDGNPLGSALRGFLAFSPGGRVAVIVVAAPVWGAHAALLILLEWGIIATAYVITGRGPDRVAVADAAKPFSQAGRAPAVGSPVRFGSSARADLPARADSPPAADSRTGMDSTAREHALAPGDSPVRMGSPGLSTSAALTRLASGTGQPENPLAPAGSPDSATTLELMMRREPARQREPKPRTVLDPRALATIAAYRDDGAAAVWLSRVVRGQFVPLPPAVAGLAATSFLAWLGMRNLPGLLLLTPLVVMLLAAFGSGHPHNGRLDWLVPAVLMVGQLMYIAAIGFSFGVWAPVTFTLCALIALRYVDLARRDRQNPAQAAETRLGWEGRMLAVGVGAMLGITAVAYVALAAYVGALVCGRVRTSVLADGERNGDPLKRR
jgi:hypothetical protein